MLYHLVHEDSLRRISNVFSVDFFVPFRQSLTSWVIVLLFQCKRFCIPGISNYLSLIYDNTLGQSGVDLVKAEERKKKEREREVA